MKYCSNCGKEVSEDMRFCHGCGQALVENEKATPLMRTKDESEHDRKVHAMAQVFQEVDVDRTRLFEGKQSRRKRIIAYTLERLGADVDKIEGLYWRHVHGGLLFGASLLASGLIEHVEPVRNAWGKGSVGKATGLLVACVSPMLSMCLGNIEMQQDVSEEQKRQYREHAILNILDIFGSRFDCLREKSGLKVRDFANLDIQFQCNYLPEERMGLLYATLLISKAVEGCGMQGVIDWDAQRFPVEQSSDLVFLEGAPHGYHPAWELLTVQLLPVCGAAMFQHIKGR